ncbi:MAG: hypothetical protein Q7T32_05910 [Moraxellaceae bacterium]|nr:hypothetical protein [Moraxellaceae bacterium]
MYRLYCLLMCLVCSAPVCADTETPLLDLSFNPETDATSTASVSGDDTAFGATALAGDPAVQAQRNKEERRAARDRILSALGVSRFMPSGHFNAFKHDGRWSLSLDDEENVTLRMRMRW